MSYNLTLAGLKVLRVLVGFWKQNYSMTYISNKYV